VNLSEHKIQIPPRNAYKTETRKGKLVVLMNFTWLLLVLFKSIINQSKLFIIEVHFSFYGVVEKKFNKWIKIKVI